MSVRIMIADDQALVRAGFKMILDAEDDIEVVGEAVDGVQAVDMARRLKPDVVLMDIRMPELDGIEATRRVVAAREDDSPTRVIMLTTFDLNEYVYEALRAGASGFLLKDAPPEQLADGIRVVSLTISSAAISALDSPRATSRKTSSSRAVSSSRPGVGAGGVGDAAANSWSSRRVIDGASSASPWATTRMPAASCSGGTSLSRKPLAPARSAS